LVFTTESLSFDTAMGELRTTDPVRITSAGVLIEFVGFTLLIDDVKQRLALFRTNSANKATIDPAQFAARSTNSDDRSGAEDSSSSSVAELIEKLYHASMTGDVRIASGALLASAERMDLWTRLIDDKPTAATLEGLRFLTDSVQSASEEDASHDESDTG